MSEIDIPAGARWGSPVDAQLEASSFAILCLTADNVETPWILFEAGAVAKAVDESRVCPYLIDLEPSELPSPLSRFQAKRADRTGTFDVVQAANACLEVGRLTESELVTVFERWWPDLEALLPGRLPTPANARSQSTERTVAETLELVREMSRVLSWTGEATARGERTGFSAAMKRLRHQLTSALDGIHADADSVTAYIANETAIPQALRERCDLRLDDLRQLSRAIWVELVTLDAHSNRIVPRTRVDLCTLLAKVRAWLSHSASRENVVVTLIGSAEPCLVEGDGDALSVAFYHILRNSLLYADREATDRYAKVVMTLHGHAVVISFEDNGIGIELPGPNV